MSDDLELLGVTYEGEALQDYDGLRRLPAEYADLLRQVNGVVLGNGAFHLRGIVEQPLWHSISWAWTGGEALHGKYPELSTDDVPFGQDVFGDQYFLRGGQVWRLWAETGEIECLRFAFIDFLKGVNAAPIPTLGLDMFEQYRAQGGEVQPGQLLNVYPPFCTQEASQGIALAAVPVLERLAFLADLARQMRSVSDGSSFSIRVG